MRPLFEECFQSDGTTTIASTTDEPKSRVFLIVVIVIVVIAIIVVIIGCLCYCKHRGNEGEVRYQKLNDLVNIYSSTTRKSSNTSTKGKNNTS